MLIFVILRLILTSGSPESQRHRDWLWPNCEFGLIVSIILTLLLGVLLGDASLFPDENMPVAGSILRSGRGRHFIALFVLCFFARFELNALFDNFRWCLLRSLHFIHSKKNRLTGYSDTVVRSVCRYWRYMNRSKNFVRLSNVVSPLTLWSYRAKTLGFHSQLTNENIHVLVYNHILQEENTGQKTNSWSCSRHYRRRRNSGWTWTITEVSCKRFRFLLSLACAQALTLIIPLFLPFSSNFSPRSKKHGPAHGARLTTSSPKPTTIHYSSYQTYPENKTHNTTKAIRVSQRIPRR